MTKNAFPSRWTRQLHHQSCLMLYVAVARKTVPQGGTHVENMVCLALLFAMNAMALAALTHNSDSDSDAFIWTQI